MSFYHYETIGQFRSDDDRTDISKNLNAGVALGKAVNTEGLNGMAIVKPGTDGSFFLGTLQNNPNVGEEAAVAIRGFCDIVAGGDFVGGDKLTAQADGSFVKATGADYDCRAITPGKAGAGAEAFFK